jgi:hypothetical protein
MVSQEGTLYALAQEEGPNRAARLGMGLLLFLVAGALCLAIFLLLGSNRAFAAVPSGSNQALNSATSAPAPVSLNPSASASSAVSATVNQIAESVPTPPAAGPTEANGPVGEAGAATSQALNPITGPAVEALAPAGQALAPVTDNLVPTTEDLVPPTSPVEQVLAPVTDKLVTTTASLVPPTSPVGQVLAPVTEVLTALTPSTQLSGGPGTQVGTTGPEAQTPSATTPNQGGSSEPSDKAPGPGTPDETTPGQSTQSAANSSMPYPPSGLLVVSPSVNGPASARTTSVARVALFDSRSTLAEGRLHPSVLTSSSGAGTPSPGSPVPVPPVPGTPQGPAAPTSGGGESATSSSGGHGPLMAYRMPLVRPDELGSRRLQPGAAGLPPSIVLSLLEAPG